MLSLITAEDAEWTCWKGPMLYGQVIDKRGCYRIHLLLFVSPMVVCVVRVVGSTAAIK